MQKITLTKRELSPEKLFQILSPLSTPLLRDFKQQCKGSKHTAIETLINRFQAEGSPIIERCPEDENYCYATFFTRDLQKQSR